MRQDYERDLEAGITLVQRGLLPADVALDRLQTAYPDLTRQLQVGDLS